MTGIAFCVRVTTDSLVHMLHPRSWSWLQLASEYRITSLKTIYCNCLFYWIYRFYPKFKLCLSAIVCQLVCFGVPCIIAAHSHLLRSLPFGVVGSCGFNFDNRNIFIIYSLPAKKFAGSNINLYNSQYNFTGTQRMYTTQYRPLPANPNRKWCLIVQKLMKEFDTHI